MSVEELHKLNRTSTGFTSDPRYMGALGVFHHLHCLVNDFIELWSAACGWADLGVELYQTVDPGRWGAKLRIPPWQALYWPLSFKQGKMKKTAIPCLFVRSHPRRARKRRMLTSDEDLSHCINSLRRYIQCAGDVSIVTYSWRPDYMWAYTYIRVNLGMGISVEVIGGLPKYANLLKGTRGLTSKKNTNAATLTFWSSGLSVDYHSHQKMSRYTGRTLSSMEKNTTNIIFQLLWKGQQS